MHPQVLRRVGADFAFDGSDLVLAQLALGGGLCTHQRNVSPQRLPDDLAALDASLATELQFHHATGAVDDKAAFLANVGGQFNAVLNSPARGYGDADEVEREAKLAGRLATLKQLGPAGMAEARAAAMLSPDATPEMVDLVRDTMAQIHPSGYTQAARMLASGRLDADLARVSVPLVVASGSADTITPPAACADVAHRKNLAWVDLGPVGHVCALEAAERVNQLLGL